MHNLLSRAQLDEWRHVEIDVDESDLEQQKINDYYECLIECDSINETSCKRVCRSILM